MEITDSSLGTILKAFSKLLPEILRDFIQKVMIGFGEYGMGLSRKPFSCEGCGNDKEFIWKTRHGKETKILTVLLWQDGVKRKGTEWLLMISELMEICAIRPLVDCQKTIEKMIESKRNRMEEAIKYCLAKGYAHTVSYLENAKPDMFSAIEKRLTGKTTSKVERVMRTVNMRVNVSKWSTAGALNVTKTCPREHGDSTCLLLQRF